ncbi:hypothetical protein N7U49_47275 [Streptomyces sp. AD2-2]|nr:hypothetical protein N7U49_47275 [Streptomyces sp. AD2-2]
MRQLTATASPRRLAQFPQLAAPLLSITGPFPGRNSSGGHPHQPPGTFTDPYLRPAASELFTRIREQCHVPARRLQQTDSISSTHVEGEGAVEGAIENAVESKVAVEGASAVESKVENAIKIEGKVAVEAAGEGEFDGAGRAVEVVGEVYGTDVDDFECTGEVALAIVAIADVLAIDAKSDFVDQAAGPVEVSDGAGRRAGRRPGQRRCPGLGGRPRLPVPVLDAPVV